MASVKSKSKNKMMKLLKENERLLMDIESKLADQLSNLKKEEIYLKTIIIREKEKEDHDSRSGQEEEEDVGIDDANMNKEPLEHLNTATSSFYQMFAGKEQTIEVHVVEEDEEEEEEERDEDSNQPKTEEEQSAEFMRLMRSMQGDG